MSSAAIFVWRFRVNSFPIKDDERRREKDKRQNEAELWMGSEPMLYNDKLFLICISDYQDSITNSKVSLDVHRSNI